MKTSAYRIFISLLAIYILPYLIYIGAPAFLQGKFSWNELFAQDYWQQEVNYTINVRLDDKKHELLAEETIEYINRSPDTLTEIYMHLWPNAYKDNTTALVKQEVEDGSTRLYYAEEHERGFIDSLDFKVNGERVKWDYDAQHVDICKLILNKPLEGGDRINITTPFLVKIPKGVFSRLGHIGESYQISQWYPKPAVYDANGWNPMPYLDMGEFYSEFGSFDVSITLPKNYVVGATGDLVDGEDELEWLADKVKETEELIRSGAFKDTASGIKGKSRSMVRFGGEDTDEKIAALSFPPSDSVMKTLRYRQSNVHDFAWFADKRWHVLKGEVELPHSGRKVDTWVMFTDEEAELWQEAIEYMNDAVYYYSLWNGDYPYNHATAVDGALSAGGGMEYPNVTVISSMGNAFLLELVIMHEVGHNWFYGILGSDERTHAWMDEGLNSFNENRYIETKYPDKKLIRADSKFAKMFDLAQYKQKSRYYFLYLLNARRNLDQPIESHSKVYTQINYGSVVYGKTALVFDYLMAYLGEQTMDLAMRRYFDRWKFKHPHPGDLRVILEDVANEDLSWFFDDMLKTNKKLDYKIIKREDLDNGMHLSVRNQGQINGPIAISGIVDGKTDTTLWYAGFSGRRSLFFPDKEYDAYRIDAQLDMPETHRKNNTLKADGIMKTVEPLKLQLLGSLENPDKTQLFFLPAVTGWNNYNQWMIGAAFYTFPIPQKKFEYVLLPMYSFGTKEIVGSAEMGLNFFPENNLFQHIRLSVSGSTYAYDRYGGDNLNFIKIAPELSFEFRKKRPRSPVKRTIVIRNVNIIEDVIVPVFSNTDGISINGTVNNKDDYSVNELSYQLRNGRTFNPFGFSVNLQLGENFAKSTIEGNYKISYKSGKGLNIRVFTGRFLYNDDAELRYGFSMNGRGGYQDYLYDEVFMGRSENSGVLSQQFINNDGGFKNLTNAGIAQKWLTSVNLKIPFPGSLPVALYADAGWASSNPEKIIAAAGVALVLIPNILEVYFPFYTSTQPNLAFPQYEKNIRFIFNLSRLNPFKLIRKIPS